MKLIKECSKLNKLDLFKKLQAEGFTNVQLREIMEAYMGYKVSRIHVDDRQKKCLEDFCKETRLLYLIGNYKVKDQVVVEKKGKWSNIGVKVDIQEKNAWWYLYIGRKLEELEVAREFDFIEKNDPHIIGKLLKIPSCCTEFFLQNKQQALDLYFDDYSILTLRNTPESCHLHYLTNYISQYFDYSLISHYLCSFNCVESKKKAEESLNIVSEIWPELANKIVQNLKKVMIFDNGNGVYSFTGKRDGDNISYDPSTIKTTAHTSFVDLLKQNTKIIYKSNFSFSVGENVIEGNGENSPVLFYFSD